MFAKVLAFSFMCLTLMSVSKCDGQKYPAPEFGDCTIITSWSEEKFVDVASLFCIDDRITKKNFETTILKTAEEVFNGHPLKTQILDYLITNKDEIVKTKEFELPISFGRGFSAVSPTDRTTLTKWAEGNRIGRIKCEYGNN